jgi:AraC-like DNA-binding protein
VTNPGANPTARLPSATGTMGRLAYAKAAAAGVALDPLLHKAGLTRRQMEDPQARLKVRDQIKFLNVAADALEDELLGFHLAQAPDLREIGLLYYVLASSEILSDAFHRAVRYSLLNNEGISQQCIDGKQFGISFRYVGVSRHLDRHQMEFWVTALVRTCRQLTGRHLLPVRLRLAHSRNDRNSEFTDFFGRPVEFGAAVDEITFTASTKHLPIVSADPFLNKLLTAYCEDALSQRSSHRSSFRSSVENAIVPLLPHGKARAAEISRRLGLSKRTFARRLSLDGLTFTDLLQGLRSDLAGRYLAEEHLSISQIAWLLGYEEVGAFSHAFKRWTGKTPREVRTLAGQQYAGA